jgi:hypothetical protein
MKNSIFVQEKIISQIDFTSYGKEPTLSETQIAAPEGI